MGLWYVLICADGLHNLIKAKLPLFLSSPRRQGPRRARYERNLFCDNPFLGPCLRGDDKKSSFALIYEILLLDVMPSSQHNLRFIAH